LVWLKLAVSKYDVSYTFDSLNETLQTGAMVNVRVNRIRARQLEKENRPGVSEIGQKTGESST
jgi:hypothetical protein